MSTIKEKPCNISWEQFEVDILTVARAIDEFRQSNSHKIAAIYGIVRGGLVPAVRLSHLLKLPLVTTGRFNKEILYVDDCADSGKTLKLFSEMGALTAVLYRKDTTMVEPNFYAKTINQWINYSWEEESLNEYRQKDSTTDSRKT